MSTKVQVHVAAAAEMPDEDDVPTRRMRDIPTLPSAISVQPLPSIDTESTRFFAAPALADSAALDDDLTEWWLDQRRRSLAPFVTAIVAACVLLLAAVAR
jgi:hypothetical protein